MEIRHLSSHVDDRLSWIGAIGLAVAVGVAYFLAARLSLSLLTKPDGVAVFWPAAGIASGTLIALGSGARAPVTVGVLTASALAGLLGDRSIPAATIFALCNAGEPLLVAWLIKRWLGTDFRLERALSTRGGRFQFCGPCRRKGTRLGLLLNGGKPADLQFTFKRKPVTGLA